MKKGKVLIVIYSFILFISLLLNVVFITNQQSSNAVPQSDVVNWSPLCKRELEILSTKKKVGILGRREEETELSKIWEELSTLQIEKIQMGNIEKLIWELLKVKSEYLSNWRATWQILPVRFRRNQEQLKPPNLY